MSIPSILPHLITIILFHEPDIIVYGPGKLWPESYEQLKKRGDRLDDIKEDNRLGWPETTVERPVHERHRTGWETELRRNTDGEILFLQSIYNIVDESMETEIYANFRFVNFLDYPERVPTRTQYGCSGRGCQRPARTRLYGRRYGDSSKKGG